MFAVPGESPGAGPPMTRRSLGLAVVAALWVGACADVWGLKDLSVGEDAGTEDATAPVEASGGGEDVRSPEPDGPAVEPGDSSAADDAPLDAIGHEAGVDAGSDGASLSGCAAACHSGCCDSSGQCQKGTSQYACGSGGGACAICNASCPVFTPTSCCSSQACTCLTICL
jgi:hypothetical protein